MSLIKKWSIYCSIMVLISSAIFPLNAAAQLNNTQPVQPPSSGSGVGQSNIGPYTNTDPNNPSTLGVDASDPGGPTGPPPDVTVPIDGGISILLAIGLVHGFQLSRKRKLKVQEKFIS